VRLAYTSDLHVDATPANAALLPHLAARVAALAPDAFVIAGDLAETLAAVRWGLDAFAALASPKFYLPGNHDLFVEGEPAAGATSRDKYERTLPAVAAACGFRYLGLEPARVGAVALAGVTGWYDLAFRDPALAAVVAPAHYAAGRWRDVRAFDRGHVFWPRDPAAGFDAAAVPGAHPAHTGGDWASDLEIEAWMRERLAAQLERCAGGPVVAIVHVLPFAALVVRGAFGAAAFHDAWLGSAAIGTCLQRCADVRAVVTGHLHRVADVVVDGMRVVARPVGPLRDPRIDLAATARERIGVLEVD
jgi:3',5'-cyclic AMP phosphodiesterase CpdA